MTAADHANTVRDVLTKNVKADRYLIGKPGTRFAVTRGWHRPSFPWRWPRGGWRLGPVTLWWSR